VIFSTEGATGLKPGVERSGAPVTDLRADERWRREKIFSSKATLNLISTHATRAA